MVHFADDRDMENMDEDIELGVGSVCISVYSFVYSIHSFINHVHMMVFSQDGLKASFHQEDSGEDARDESRHGHPIPDQERFLPIGW